MTTSTDSNIKYAIYGGSFDPIHRAHVALADAAVEQLGLDELFFMPANVSPFKLDSISKQSSGKDRFAMIEAILHYNSAFRLSDYELVKEGPSYTIETLEYWDNNRAGKFYFVLGFDSAVQIDTWYHGIEILSRFPLITCIRPGTGIEEGIAKINYYKAKYGTEIHILDMPPMDISSTIIRRRISEGTSIGDLVMPETEEYISEHHLYR